MTLHPHPNVDKIVTEVILNSLTPHWNYQCLTHIPILYLEPHVSCLYICTHAHTHIGMYAYELHVHVLIYTILSSPKVGIQNSLFISFLSALQCLGLELQVWSGVSNDSSSATGCQEGDSYIGCALVDLSTLALGLPQISGWYNITDFGGQLQGQIKVLTTASIYTLWMYLHPLHVQHH